MPNPAYPSVFIGKDSRRTSRDGREEDQIGDGSTRVRKLFSDKYDFDIVHPYATTSQVSTLQTFYDTYGTTDAIDFTWTDGNVYPVRFGKGGLDIQPSTPARRNVRVRLVGV